MIILRNWNSEKKIKCTLLCADKNPLKLGKALIGKMGNFFSLKQPVLSFYTRRSGDEQPNIFKYTLVKYQIKSVMCILLNGGRHMGEGDKIRGDII